MKSLIFNFFIYSGFCLIFLSSLLIYQHFSPQRISFNIDNLNTRPNLEKVDNLPAQIRIKNLGIILPIIPEQLQNGKWQVSDKGVNYLISTPMPGEVGNSIMYGHNWTNLLGKLVKAKPGFEVEVLYPNSITKRFIIDSVVEVSPNQTTILNQTEESRLTLYTCSGFLDSKRLVVSAKLVL